MERDGQQAKKTAQETAPDLPPRAVEDQELVDDLLGTTYLDKYELLEVLGIGGMGVIYLGRQVFLDRLVAIKLLKNPMAAVKARTRFHQEAKAASALKHSGIVGVLDFGVDDLDRPYMVMEHVEGCTVSDLLEERVTLSVEEILPVFLEICDALSEAHKKGIVHRDLKPSNIMLVVDDDGNPHIKILDFGIAKMLEMEDRTVQDLTKTGDALGTPLYMSPEQVRGKDVTYKSDLYSLGCMLYACLTGTPPFIGESKMATMDMHITDRPMPLREASEGLEFPPGIEAIVMRLLEKKPEQRFENAEELKKALIEMAMRNGFIPSAAGSLPSAVGDLPSVAGGQYGQGLMHSGHMQPGQMQPGQSHNPNSSSDKAQPMAPPPGGAPQQATGVNPRSGHGRSAGKDQFDARLADTESAEFHRKMERNANTVYWNSDLTNRVRAAQADRSRTLPRRTASQGDQEEDGGGQAEESLKKSFMIVGAITVSLLLVGAVMLFVAGRPQTASSAKASAEIATSKLPTDQNGQSVPGSSANQSGSAGQSASSLHAGEAGQTAATIQSPTSSQNLSSQNSSSRDSSSRDSSSQDSSSRDSLPPDSASRDLSSSPDIPDRTADDIIHEKMAAGAADSSISLKEQDGLTRKGLFDLRRFTLLRNLDLRGTSLKADATNYLADLPVSTLCLDVNKGITNDSLPALAKMKGLQFLSLAATGISDDGLKSLAHSPTIISLWLGYNPGITNQGVRNLSPITSPLRSLFLNDCRLTDDCAEDLTKFEYMFSLDLEGNPGIGDNTVEVLSARKQGLQCLVLANDHIHDAGIHALSQCKGLRTLDLSGIQLSPAAQADLCTMKGLANLYLVKCNLTAYEIGKLTKALPQTTVETNNRLKSKLL